VFVLARSYIVGPPGLLRPLLVPADEPPGGGLAVGREPGRGLDQLWAVFVEEHRGSDSVVIRVLQQEHQ